MRRPRKVRSRIASVIMKLVWWGIEIGSFLLTFRTGKAKGMKQQDQEFKARTREPVCLPHPHKLHKITGIFENYLTVLSNGLIVWEITYDKLFGAPLCMSKRGE